MSDEAGVKLAEQLVSYATIKDRLEQLAKIVTNIVAVFSFAAAIFGTFLLTIYLHYEGAPPLLLDAAGYFQFLILMLLWLSILGGIAVSFLAAPVLGKRLLPNYVFEYSAFKRYLLIHSSIPLSLLSFAIGIFLDNTEYPVISLVGTAVFIAALVAGAFAAVEAIKGQANGQNQGSHWLDAAWKYFARYIAFNYLSLTWVTILIGITFTIMSASTHEISDLAAVAIISLILLIPGFVHYRMVENRTSLKVILTGLCFAFFVITTALPGPFFVTTITLRWLNVGGGIPVSIRYPDSDEKNWVKGCLLLGIGQVVIIRPTDEKTGCPLPVIPFISQIVALGQKLDLLDRQETASVPPTITIKRENLDMKRGWEIQPSGTQSESHRR